MAGITVLAQGNHRKQHHKNEMEQFTPEQKSQLMVKKMTLELDLNASQQKEISTLFLEKIAKKEAHKAEMKAMKEKGTKPTADERFAMESKRLDDQIADKKRMEKILNAKQFEKWTAIKEEHRSHKNDRKANRFENRERRG